MTEYDQNNSTEILVGRRLHAMRINKGFSLRSLSEHSGLNINTLSLIENGKTSPSVSTLQQISTTLGIPISYFFESEPVHQRLVFTPITERTSIMVGETRLENLGKNLKDNAIQPFIVSMPKGSGFGEKAIVHTGHEFVYCLEGKVLYEVDGEKYELTPGDSLVFQAHLPHKWENSGDDPAQFLLIISPADHEDEPVGRHFSKENNGQEINMKIAVVSDDGKNLSQHFGRAPFYIVYTIEEAKIKEREVREKLGHNQFGGEGHEHHHGQDHGNHTAAHGKHVSMAEAISDCSVLICGGMGMGAYESMKRLNIKPFVTDCPDPEEAVQAYIKGELVDHIEKLH